MLYVSIIVELLRARPALAMWIAAVAQALLWLLVPTLFYAGPPGDVPAVLAVGHEFQFGTYLGPPLAFWLAEIAFRLAGRSLFGVYLLSQICVVVTYWAVFTLGRSIVGAQHAVLAVLLMVGISNFTVPTPDFGPVVLTMALWAVVLLHYWRAIEENRRRYWVALAIEIGLLLLTTYAALILVGLLLMFTLGNKRARATLRTRDPWLAVIVALIVTLPHLLWLFGASDGVLPMLSRLRTPESAIDNFSSWLKQIALILAAHAGFAVLIALVMGWPWTKQERAPVVVRGPVDSFARQFVYFFALTPALVATVGGVLIGGSGPVGGVAPIVILSGLAVIVAAGDVIELAHQRVLISAWFGLLIVPPAMAVVAVLALPWVGIDLSVNRPVPAMAQFFSDSFQRRIGTPASIVAGEPRTAALVALGSSSRPSLFLNATPERSPWVTMNDIVAKGAIVVWPTTDTAGTPPTGIKERFPDLVPEVPRSFERPIQGQLGLLRIGWAVIRPKSEDKEPPPEGAARP
jgi:4-amino-4-deoxy-L-arabinose transferase-like glycosyltransferase